MSTASARGSFESPRSRRRQQPPPSISDQGKENQHCHHQSDTSREARWAAHNPLAPSMSSFLENAYSLVHQDNAADVPSMSELRTQLEKGTDESKVQTMKSILTIMLNGDPMPQLLMHIIRFVMPSKSKPLKKLLYFYYEICPKLDAGGKLKQEMILVWYASTTSCCLAPPPPQRCESHVSMRTDSVCPAATA